MNRLFVAAIFDLASSDSVAESFDSVVAAAAFDLASFDSVVAAAAFDLASFDSVFVENYPVFPAVSAN